MQDGNTGDGVEHGNKSMSDVSNPANQSGTPVLKNDLLDTAAVLGSEGFAKIAELTKYKFERAKAGKWASRGIRFLVYDDSDVTTNGFDSDDEEGQEEHAMRMSIGESKPQKPGYSDETWKSSCRVCAWYPEFPHKWKPRKFRLVNPTLDHPEWFAKENAASIDICMHYVAVSYCWPPREENPAPRRYQVRDLDGQVRSSRALDNVLDRAVDFANSCGLRMIWIDQECLPQPNAASSKDDWNEQELGIQAMDIVYNRAMVTAGLLSVEIDSQEVLTAIEILLSPDRTARQRMMNRQSCENILALMHKMEQDRWYTRAWVIQEAICAGEKLMIAFWRSPGLQFRSKFRVGYQAEKDDRPYHSLDDNPRGLETSLACINVCEFWRVLDDMKSLLVRDFARVGNFLHRVGNGPAHVDLDARWVLKEAEYLHPRFERANTLQQHMKMYAEGYYGKRPTINAAGALTLLKHRQCYFESDRLAIIANMCDYEFRLDTKAVQNNCESLRLAILSLALNNGDLSLLVREAFLPWMHVYSDNVYNASMGNSLLFHDFFTESPRVEHCRVRDFINIRLQRQQPAEVTSRGLLLPSYIWSVDREIDFTPLKYRWADTWEAVKCWNIIVDKQKNETTEGYQTRQDAMVRRLAQPGIAEQALREFRELGHVPQTSTVWGGIDSAGIQMTRHVSAKRVKLVPEIRKIIAQIIFDILRYAWTISKEVALAKGLANSIWQSVRVDQVPGSEKELPDEVGDALFDHEDVLSQPFATLQLDETLNCEFAQLWFIDRIMEHGKLWCGTYIRPDTPLDGTVDEISDPDNIQQEGLEDDIQVEPSASEQGSEDRGAQTIIGRQISRQMLVTMLGSASFGRAQPGQWRPSTHSLVALTECLRKDYWTDRGERRRQRTLLSTFDVDGPCRVATPYNPEWEVLPRPELRSMSTCWVVEPRQDSSGTTVSNRQVHDNASEKADPGIASSAKGKGKKRAFDDFNMDRDIEDSTISSLGERFGDQSLNLQVLRKVRGLWQIMDLPSQQYVFC